jgi:hypothetical protein
MPAADPLIYDLVLKRIIFLILIRVVHWAMEGEVGSLAISGGALVQAAAPWVASLQLIDLGL